MSDPSLIWLATAFRTRSRRTLSGVLLVAFTLTALATNAFAQTTPSVTVGGGVRTSMTVIDPEDEDATTRFLLDSVRIYFGGSATESIKFMLNTEYNGGPNEVEIMDAAAQIALSSTHNLWVGRFLPPSDRANLYGPYYAHHWNVYTDSVQDGYPFIFQGRANGAMYWGQYGKVKVSGGVFDGSSMTPDDTVVGAGRVQVDFWDAEDGYYLNGTYYGDKDLLALGVAGQFQGSDGSAGSVDFLLERGVGDGGAYTIEAEYAVYDKLGGYNADYARNDGGYVLGSYLFPALVGVGRFEVLGKFASARFRDGLTPLDVDVDQKTTEINLNYVIKQFNARVMVFYLNQNFDARYQDQNRFGVGLQIQM